MCTHQKMQHRLHSERGGLLDRSRKINSTIVSDANSKQGMLTWAMGTRQPISISLECAFVPFVLIYQISILTSDLRNTE
jgi:hypothetical protein